MKALRVAICVFVFLIAVCISRAQSLGNDDDKLSGVAMLLPQHHHSDASGPTFTLDEIERMALAGNPEIRVAARRLAVVEAGLPSAGALDDPSFMYRGWQVPLKQPWNYNAAQNMFMLSQTLPGRGKRGLRTNVAEASVAEAKAALEATRLDVRVRVRKAFYDLLRAEEGLRVHDEHVDIGRQAVEAAKIKYVVGKVPQHDILKSQVSLARLAEHLIRFEQDANIARARLNTLLSRDPSAPINVRGQHEVSSALPALEALERLALQSRPDLLEIQASAEKSRNEQALAQRTYTPDFTVSVGYMLMPRGSEFRNNYMIEGSMNLPWLNHRKHDAEIAESAAKVTEQDAELAAMRNIAFGQIQEALVEAQAAQKLANFYERSLRPQAEATLHSTVIAYENDRTEFLDLLDSQMTVIDIDLAYFQALADFEAHLADLELAVGAPINQVQKSTAEVTQ
jgi:cobalt-zinc-cadmium efflux system outer membrane protein